MEARFEKAIQSNKVFENSWLKISVDTVEIDGGIEAQRFVLKHICASAILAITDEHKVILVEQFRYPTGQVLYEIPAGKLDVWGGDFYATAMREFAEETPFTAESMRLISAFYTAPGFTDEFIHLYKAHGLKKNSQLSGDSDEFLGLTFFDKKEVVEMIKNGTIRDAKTLIALQHWLLEEQYGY